MSCLDTKLQAQTVNVWPLVSWERGSVDEHVCELQWACPGDGDVSCLLTAGGKGVRRFLEAGCCDSEQTV